MLLALTMPTFVKNAWLKVRSWIPWVKKNKPSPEWDPQIEGVHSHPAPPAPPERKPRFEFDEAWLFDDEPEAEIQPEESELLGPLGSPATNPVDRRSVLANRYGRLPFGRRFTLPVPDGAIEAQDRQIISGEYAGIAAGDEQEAQELHMRYPVRTVKVRPVRLVQQMTGRAPRFWHA